jgi:hypothetical protein
MRDESERELCWSLSFLIHRSSFIVHPLGQGLSTDSGSGLHRGNGFNAGSQGVQGGETRRVSENPPGLGGLSTDWGRGLHGGNGFNAGAQRCKGDPVGFLKPAGSWGDCELRVVPKDQDFDPHYGQTVCDLALTV